MLYSQGRGKLGRKYHLQNEELKAARIKKTLVLRGWSIQPSAWYTRCFEILPTLVLHGVSIRISPGKKMYWVSDSGTEASLSVEAIFSKWNPRVARLWFRITTLNRNMKAISISMSKPSNAFDKGTTPVLEASLRCWRKLSGANRSQQLWTELLLGQLLTKDFSGELSLRRSKRRPLLCSWSQISTRWVTVLGMKKITSVFKCAV